MSSFTLKIIAIILMTMDHMYTYFNQAGADIPIWFGYLGKLASPIFFYLIVEGFFHTRSRKKYIQRVFSMGLIMAIIDVILKINNNIFLSIGCGLLMLTGIDIAKNNEKGSKEHRKGVCLSILFGILGLFTEASIFGVAMILIFYFFRENKFMMIVTYAIISLFGMTGVIGPDFIEAIMLWDYQWMMVFAIVPILMYNGKRGINNKFVKWMFYWFYPIHLIVIISIAQLIK